MTTLTVQKLSVHDCEGLIERGYYEWGKGRDEDQLAPLWESAAPEQRRSIALRGYNLYDGWPTQPGDELSAIEAYVSIGINSFVILYDVVRYLSVADHARPILARIPDDAMLEDAGEPIIAAVSELVRLLDQLWQFDIAKATKILHKKRPGLIPVIDSRVKDFLWKNFPHRLQENSHLRDYLIIYREILRSRSEQLASIHGQLANRGFHLTTARILSYLIWQSWPNTPTINSVWSAANLAEAKRLAEQSWEHRDQTGR